MTDRIKLPSSIDRMVGGEPYETDEIGRSGSAVLILSNKVLKIEKITENARSEYRMLSYLQGKLPVPQILAFEEAEGYQYLLMTKLRGNMACADGYDPKTVTLGLADGLKTLWNVDLTGCPRRYTVADRLSDAKKRLDHGLFEGKKPLGTAFESFDSLYRYLCEHRIEETLVFSHGDYCLPNIFLDGEKAVGFLDLGCSGVADQWYDMMMCLWSMRYNFCEFLGMPEREFQKYKELFFEALHLTEDPDKLRYHQLLDLFFE